MKYIEPDWPAPSNIKAFTTLRTSWGQKTGYDKSSEIAHLQKLLQLPSAPIWFDQKHTGIALEADPVNHEKIADAAFTTNANCVCMILTADCLPVLVCNKEGTKVAAIHAGWRGLASGIIESTLAALKMPPDEVLVWLGPAIGPQKFEVGRDVYDAFTSKHNEATLAFTPYKEEKWLADLYALATMRLQAQGITQIYGGNYCTYTQDDLFYSYRRDKGVTGRMASVIWINK